MVRLDRSLRRISRQFEENVYTTLKVGPRGRMTDAQLYKRYWFLFLWCFKGVFDQKLRKKQPFFDHFWSKIDIFDFSIIFNGSKWVTFDQNGVFDQKWQKRKKRWPFLTIFDQKMTFLTFNGSLTVKIGDKTRKSHDPFWPFLIKI